MVRLNARSIALTTALLVTPAVAGCGYNTIPTKQERAEAAWADVKEGRVDQVIAEALKSGDINEEELGQIIAAHRQHLAARHAEVNAVIALHRKAKP